MKLSRLAGILGICAASAASGAYGSDRQNPGDAVSTPNPASKLCVDLGGESQIYSLNTGAKIGLCKFADEEFLAGYIGEWTLARNYARKPAGSKAVAAYFAHAEYQGPGEGELAGHPAKRYCAQVGGESQNISDETGESGICRFDDNSVIEEWTLFRGPETHTALTGALNTHIPADDQG